MSDIVSYTGKILFEPPNKTKKHLSQSDWKRVAMLVFDGDLTDYYSWFLKKRFNIELNKPLRGAHITFINDNVKDINSKQGTEEEKNVLWEKLKQKWHGKEISVTLNLRPFSDVSHWWLIVDHKYRDELHNIRAEIGLGKPYFGLHMTIGLTHPLHMEYAEHLKKLDEKGFIEINSDYGR